MAKFYYNGVLLPEIPADALANYPYCWIRNNTRTGYYDLLLSQSQWYLQDEDTIAHSDSNAIQWYRIEIASADAANEWAFNTEYSAEGWGNESDRLIMWANHDIPNGSATATEIYFYGSDPIPESGGEPTTDILYTVYGSSLTAVANAIRGKTGTTGELSFPDGYVSAVNDISSVSDLSNAKDIAFGGNESGGKYVIEDETITPLFDQIQRITETEEALTFEGAEQALLNVVPGGGLPVAEEWSFGRDSGAEYGITITDTSKVTYYMLGGDYPCIVNYKAKQAFSLLGVRIYERRPTGGNEGREVKVSINDELKTTVNIAYGAGVNGWNTLYFDQPFTVAVGDVINLYEKYESYPAHISTAYVTFNDKIEYAGGSYDSNIRGIFDVIIGSVETDVPDEYQITRTTMDDIANEIKRISGATGKITTSQILATLQSIQLQDKSVTPTTEVQTVTPDDGYFALSSVTVGAITE